MQSCLICCLRFVFCQLYIDEFPRSVQWFWNQCYFSSIYYLILNHHPCADDTRLFFSFYPDFDSHITHLHGVSKKFPALKSLWLCHILTYFQNFCTAGDRTKFASKNPYDITNLTLGMLLRYLGKFKKCQQTAMLRWSALSFCFRSSRRLPLTLSSLRTKRCYLQSVRGKTR